MFSIYSNCKPSLCNNAKTMANCKNNMARLYKSIIHLQHTNCSFELSLPARRLWEQQRDINLPAMLPWPRLSGPDPFLLWACGWRVGFSHRVLDQGKLPEPKGKQGQLACRSGQQLSITPLAQSSNPWPQLRPGASERCRKRGQAFSTSASSGHTGVRGPSPG